ncbi:MAG: hypothetical protein O7G87_11530 [bacterium]|nr:hypothetical protein [bacterium]
MKNLIHQIAIQNSRGAVRPNVNLNANNNDDNNPIRRRAGPAYA